MAEKHFLEQRRHAESYLIPFLEQRCPGFRNFQILDVGCAEAGFLDALHAAHIQGVGLELEAGRIAISKSFNPDLNILEGDITNADIISRINRAFDLIVIRDVIEHISDKDLVFRHLSALLKPGGLVYVTFPPRLSPFGGHQQNGRSPLRYLPYLHLLPPALLRLLGKIAGEEPQFLESVIRQGKIGLGIRQFESLVARHGFSFHCKDFFLFRPVFRVRYGLPTQRMIDIPGLREFLVLGCECLLLKPSR